MSRRWKLGLLLWSAGMLGVVAMVLLVLPDLLARLPELLPDEPPPPVPMWVLMVASFGQTGALLALAVWGGVVLAPVAGLRAPAFEAFSDRAPVLAALRSQLVPGLLTGILGGLSLAWFIGHAPTAVRAVQGRIAMPLVVRLLYGGITEEVLLRWGFMTLLVWLGWRFGLRRTPWTWAAVVLSALLFAAGHLPAAFLFVGALTPAVVSYVLVVNALFGIAFGALYWRYGLEAAIVAHAVSHLTCFLIRG